MEFRSRGGSDGFQARAASTLQGFARQRLQTRRGRRLDTQAGRSSRCPDGTPKRSMSRRSPSQIQRIRPKQMTGPFVHPASSALFGRRRRIFRRGLVLVSGQRFAGQNYGNVPLRRITRLAAAIFVSSGRRISTAAARVHSALRRRARPRRVQPRLKRPPRLPPPRWPKSRPCRFRFS